MIKITLPVEGFKEIEQRGSNVFFVRYDVVKEEGQEVLECSEDGVLINGAPNYGKLVSAIIGIKYSIDAQIAILANKGDEIPEHEAEYIAFEAWRAEAKRLAKTIFTIAIEEE